MSCVSAGNTCVHPFLSEAVSFCFGLPQCWTVIQKDEPDKALSVLCCFLSGCSSWGQKWDSSLLSLHCHLLLTPSVCLYLKFYDRYDRKDTVRRVGAVWASRHPLEALVSLGWGLLCMYGNVPAHSTTCPTVLENGFLFFFSFPEQRRL